ncbi:hypothetical protein KMZ15_08920 [Mycoavidus sp. HKI]|nr:hypothetical protein [Mycoavidus sp. HKI]UTU47255.1 hypothetical protein KMZ15_08920 [Mycoavidus sp. HKI]
MNVNIPLYRLQAKFVTSHEHAAPPILTKPADQTARRCTMVAPGY